MMRIAVFCPLISPWSRQAVLRIKELGHEVHLIDFSSPGQQTGYLHGREDIFDDDIDLLKNSIDGVHLIGTRIKSRFKYVAYALELRRLCKYCGVDVLLTLWGGGWALMSYLSGFRPYSVFVGGGDIMLIRGLQKQISRRTLNKAAVVFANGQYFGRKTKEFAPKANILPLYYGVDLERFNPGPLPSKPIRIVCSRGFSELYNNGYLVESLAEMDQGVPEWEVTFTSPGELLKDTTMLADNLLSSELRSRVCFLNGVTDSEMLSTLKNSHIYVSLSRSDGTSISLLEALACGLFPVLSDIPQNREWVTPSLNNGLLVPLDQPKVLADALKKALLDDELRIRARDINRQLVLERADSRKNMKILMNNLKLYTS